MLYLPENPPSDDGLDLFCADFHQVFSRIGFGRNDPFEIDSIRNDLMFILEGNFGAA